MSFVVSRTSQFEVIKYFEISFTVKTVLAFMHRTVLSFMHRTVLAFMHRTELAFMHRTDREAKKYL